MSETQHAVLDPALAPPFPKAALPVLRNPQLRKNVAHAIDVIQSKRARLVAEKKDWQELRSAAAAIRAHALENLGFYLEQFEERCTAAGGVVHWASDAAEARQIVLDILRQEKAREVIKIKTMTSAEIQLNPVLEAAGIQRFETDLAEIILQLGEGEPSHIVVPALHVNRSQVREIFARRMGMPDLSDDPQALTAAARNYLRQKFLAVPTAISGANFLIAETGVGGHCRVGRQRPHVPHPAADADHAGRHREGAAALPGSRSDAAGAGALGHRRAHEPIHFVVDGVTPGDGPQRFHVVLLDNGRSGILKRDREAADAALHPLRGLHEHLPGLPADRRPRLRVGVSGPHRRDSDAATHGHAARAVAAFCIVVVRRVLRSVPGQDQYSRSPDRSARPGHGPGARPGAAIFRSDVCRACALRTSFFRAHGSSTSAQRLGRIGLGLFTRKDGWIHSLPSVGAKWSQTRDLRGLPKQTFHAWWADRREETK